MQYFLSLLAFVACPVGMGLMMWLMMRGTKEQAPREADQMHTSPYNQSSEVAHESPQGTSVLKMFAMCLNWKVVVGLAVVGLIVLVVAPQFIWAALPLLIVAACPLSMLFMMGGMSGGESQNAGQPAEMSYSPAVELTDDEQVAELQSRLSSVQAQQEAIASQIAELENRREAAQPEDGAVSQAVNRRGEFRSTPL